MKHNKFGKQKGMVKFNRPPVHNNKKKGSDSQKANQRADHKSEDLEPKKKMPKLAKDVSDLASSASEEHSSCTLGSDDSMEDFDMDDYDSSDDSLLDKDMDDSDKDGDTTEEAVVEKENPVEKKEESNKVVCNDDSAKLNEMKIPPSKQQSKEVATPAKEVKFSGIEAELTKVLLDNVEVVTKAILKVVQDAVGNSSVVAKLEVKRNENPPSVKLDQKIVVPDISKPRNVVDTPMPKKKHLLSSPAANSSGGGKKKNKKNKKRKASN